MIELTKTQKNEFRYEWNGVLLFIVSEEELHKHDIVAILEKAKLNLLENL